MLRPRSPACRRSCSRCSPNAPPKSTTRWPSRLARSVVVRGGIRRDGSGRRWAGRRRLTPAPTRPAPASEICGHGGPLRRPSSTTPGRLEAALDEAGPRPEPVPMVAFDEIIDRLSAGGSTWARADVLRVICDLQPAVSAISGHRWRSPRTCLRPGDRLLGRSRSPASMSPDWVGPWRAQLQHRREGLVDDLDDRARRRAEAAVELAGLQPTHARHASFGHHRRTLRRVKTANHRLAEAESRIVDIHAGVASI
jgi:hypothetical protein